MSTAGAAIHHKTSFYVWIWFALVAMLGISLALDGHTTLATVLIFAMATLKAYLVAVYYMGLAWEPGYIAMILIIGILFMIILFVALIPDIIYVYGKI